MVFQNYALWPHMTVKRTSLRTQDAKARRATIAERVAAGLRKVNLAGLELRYPGQLSGGRSSASRSPAPFVLNPDILLLDEPLSNLDAKIRVQVRAEIRKLQKDLGITTVYVTHDQEEALRSSDRVAVIRDGRVLQVAPPKELYERPVGRFVADFVGTNNFLSGTCREIAAGRVAAERPSVPCGARRRPGSASAIAACWRCAPRTSRSGAAPRTRSRAGRAGRVLGSTLRYDVEMRAGVVLKVDVGDPLAPRGAAGGCGGVRHLPASAALTLPENDTARGRFCLRPPRSSRAHGPRYNGAGSLLSQATPGPSRGSRAPLQRRRSLRLRPPPVQAGSRAPLQRRRVASVSATPVQAGLTGPATTAPGRFCLRPPPVQAGLTAPLQ